MVDEATILAAERLRDELEDFRKSLRARFKPASRQVASEEYRKRAARLAEIWLAELSGDPNFTNTIGPEVAADLAVHFQRLLTMSEHATVRSRYDVEIRSVLNDYAVKVVLPLKQARGKRQDVPVVAVKTPILSAFVGQSFAPADKRINDCVRDTLEGLGIKVITGERPRADKISEKVKRLIEEQAIFVGIFSRRDKIARRDEWTTSAWVLDEKAYALGCQKPLVLLKEEGVGSIGGIQGDYEYIDFSRGALEGLAIRLLQVFDLTNNGLRR